MADNNISADTPSTDLRAVVDIVGRFDRPSDAPDAELRPYIDQVRGMHWLDDVPGTGSHNAPHRPLVLKATAFAPEVRSQIENQLLALPPEARGEAESRLVEETLRKLALVNRGRIGVGAAALPYHGELAQLVMDSEGLDRQIAIYRRELDAVVGHRTVTNEATGESWAEPILKLTPERRKAYEGHVLDLERQKRLLMDPDGGLGLEGAKRVRAAEIESARILKRQNEEREDAAEVKRQIAARKRQKRIDQQVTALMRLEGDSE